ncbi:MAG: DUF2059 domain-containing protein [Candidatus Babeliales bacterium]|nr:DUF2059 domain-containing protein [Candidatus Babeliales bacterium]
MKNAYALLLALTLSTSVIIADDNMAPATNCNLEVNEDLTELLNLLMQRDLLMKNMKSVFTQTTRGIAEEQSNVSEKMLNKFEEKFNSPEVRQEMFTCYTKHYSNAEISELLKFYKSPVGLKTIETTSEIMNESSQIIMKIVQDIMMEFMPINNQELDLEPLNTEMLQTETEVTN